MLRRFSYLFAFRPPWPPLTGYFANWKIFEPRKLMPPSIELCSAPIAVITEITEKTPMVIPTIVSPERSLFAPNDCVAIARISRNSMALLVSKRRHRIEARRRPGWSETGNEARENGNEHPDKDEAERELDGEGGKRFRYSEAHQVSERQSDEAAQNAERGRLDQKLKQDRAPARAQGLACPDFFRALLHAHKSNVHDPDGADEKR